MFMMNSYRLSILQRSERSVEGEEGLSCIWDSQTDGLVSTSLVACKRALSPLLTALPNTNQSRAQPIENLIFVSGQFLASRRNEPKEIPDLQERNY